jgi:hypothetical protein|tara:strand:+ start:119 stop:400 length:282 start_codon:yes stop_codon:yes gene_type:complete
VHLDRVRLKLRLRARARLRARVRVKAKVRVGVKGAWQRTTEERVLMTMTSLSGWRSLCACSSSRVQARTTGRNAASRWMAAASVGSVVLPSPV